MIKSKMSYLPPNYLQYVHNTYTVFKLHVAILCITNLKLRTKFNRDFLMNKMDVDVKKVFCFL